MAKPVPGKLNPAHGAAVRRMLATRAAAEEARQEGCDHTVRAEGYRS